MPHKIFAQLFAMCLLAVPVMAQNTSTPVRSPEGKENTRTVTVTGCLERGAQPNTFVLSKAPDPLADSVAVASGAAAPTITYQLSGGQNLGTHLGHKVEVTGTTPLRPQTPRPITDTEKKTEQSSGKTTAVTEVKERAAIAVRPLTVQQVRMVAADCAAK